MYLMRISLPETQCFLWGRPLSSSSSCHAPPLLHPIPPLNHPLPHLSLKKQTNVKNEICKLKFRFSALQTQWWKKSKQICVLLFHLLWPMHVFPLLFVSLSLCPALWQANHNCLSNHSIISLLWLVVSLSSLAQFIQDTQINMLCLTWSMSFYFCCHWEVQSNTLIMHNFRSWPMFKT